MFFFSSHWKCIYFIRKLSSNSLIFNNMHLAKRPWKQNGIYAAQRPYFNIETITSMLSVKLKLHTHSTYLVQNPFSSLPQTGMAMLCLGNSRLMTTGGLQHGKVWSFIHCLKLSNIYFWREGISETDWLMSGMKSQKGMVLVSAVSDSLTEQMLNVLLSGICTN